MKKVFETEIYFTPKQAAQYFNLSISTVKNYIYAGKLKTLKTPGGHHRIRRGELLSTLGELSYNSAEGVHGMDLISGICAALVGVFKAFNSLSNPLTLHSHRVSSLAAKIAKAAGMNPEEARLVEMAGLVHDIGLVGIEKGTLLKSGPLTLEEYKSIKSHPQIGRDILNSIKGFKAIADIVLEHHERVDGSGYPGSLRQETIKKGSRIISVAEAFDTMVSDYSYKAPVSNDMAIKELAQHSGSQFDGDIVKIFSEIA